MSTTVEARLAALGHTLPEVPVPVAAYIPARVSGNLVFVSGMIAREGGEVLHPGVVGGGVTVEQAQECARRCAMNGLAAAKGVLGTLDRITGVVRVGVFVACVPGFTDQPKVANGASDLLVAVFGEAGRHARAAVGAPSLPLGAPVEVEFVLEIKG